MPRLDPPEHDDLGRAIGKMRTAVGHGLISVFHPSPGSGEIVNIFGDIMTLSIALLGVLRGSVVNISFAYQSKLRTPTMSRYLMPRAVKRLPIAPAHRSVSLISIRRFFA
jgi:hypothetical protein